MANNNTGSKKQSKHVYDIEYFTLLDGTDIEVKPLSIRRLRKAQDLINTALEGSPVLDDEGNPTTDASGDVVKEVNNDDLLDAFVDVAAMVVEGKEGCEHFNEPEEGREALEEALDQNTLYEIIRASTGYDFLAMRKRLEQMVMEGPIQ